jgi:hypothetical protein
MGAAMGVGKMLVKGLIEHFGEVAMAGVQIFDIASGAKKGAEIEAKLIELAESYDNELESLKEKDDQIVADIDSIKDELTAYKEENNVFKKKMMLVAILEGIGIIVAILLAILL